MYYFNSGIFSKYKTELMGVATLLIIACHAPVYGVAMPQWMNAILGSGGFGVDIFLFLSGMGIYNSYMKNKAEKGNVLYWLLKRYLRIIIPCVMLMLPVFIWNPQNAERGIASYVIELSGFGAVVRHAPLWFISCILILYFVTPLISVVLNGKHKWSWLVVLSLSCLIYSYFPPHTDIWHFMLQRWPSYFLGFALSSHINAQKRYPIWCFVVLPFVAYVILYMLNHKAGAYFSLFWLQGISMMTLSAMVIDRWKNDKLNLALKFMGVISLESYVTNEYFLRAFSAYLGKLDGYNPGNWTFYIGGTIICLIASYVVNRISHRLLRIMR